jgi:hypothetical protein
MATTTNYSWSTPDDTALVKDGAAAIRSLGTAIDTTVFNNAGAAIAKTIVDAKGDIIAATAADTVARLAYSATNGDLLTVDTSTATGLKWATPAAAGGMTLLTTTTLSGSSTTSATFSSDYKMLTIYIKNVVCSAGAQFYIRLNEDTGSNYSYRTIVQNDTAAENPGTAFRIANVGTGTGLSAGNTIMTLMRPSDTDTVFATASTAETTGPSFWDFVGQYDNSAAITKITFYPGSGTWSSGTAYIYGVN